MKNKLKSTKGKSDYEVFLKLLRFSAQRGFSQEQAHRCLQKIIKEDWE
ncbi:MAG: RecX family transcriptional regulator [Bacteroidaceae bacterium]|nr:RecX family transcriptional regulator [Bacteroidaceae bacterium]